MRCTRFPIVALPPLIFAASACAPTEEQAETPAEEAAATAADVEALKALEETVVAAFKAGESDPLAALYPEDVVVLAPNQPALVGKLLKRKAGGEPVVDSGKFIVIWRRAPDGWKRAMVIWNSDSPLPGGQ